MWCTVIKLRLSYCSGLETGTVMRNLFLDAARRAINPAPVLIIYRDSTTVGFVSIPSLLIQIVTLAEIRTLLS